MGDGEGGICFVGDVGEIGGGVMKLEWEVNMFLWYGERGFGLFVGGGCVEERIIKCV